MSLNLDKRIRSLQNIQTVFLGCKDWLFMGKMGYFADNLTEFRDLTKCVYGEYMGFAEKDKCFTAEVRGNATQFEFRYFIPEDDLKPKEPEKKYRPFSLNEFTGLYAISDVVTYRIKDCEVIEQSMFIGCQSSNDGDTPGNGYVVIGNCKYSLKELFNNYELQYLNHWQPFGILEEE